MTTNLNFKPGLDRSPWRPEALLPAAGSIGQAAAHDIRNNNQRNPLVWWLRSTSIIDAFNTVTGDWYSTLYAPNISSVSAGSTMVFHPSQGPGVGTTVAGGSIGTISAGTTTTVTLSTALGTAVGLNQLADRGDGTGFRMRVIGFRAGGSGKTEEVTITANSAGTTPVVTFTPALTFTPAANDGYEILSGKLYCLGSGAISATTWKSIDIATGTVAALSQTNLAATIATDSFALVTAEVYVSNDRSPGDGFINDASTYNNGNSKCILASATAGTTITATALTAPSTPSLATNEYRNFMIRVVEDTTAPTAVGQRRNITSHTSGNTPVFTVPTWTVTPTAGVAKFVVEQNNDRILLRTSATTNMYNYSISGNAWDASTTWTAGGSANGAGNMMAPCFGIIRDASGNRLQGQIFVFRGAATATLDLFDITAAATGAWTAGVAYGFSAQTFTTGACGCYDPVCNNGQLFHISLNTSAAPARMFRFNVMTQTLEIGTMLPYPGGTSQVSQRMFMGYAFDGAVKLPLLYQLTASQQQMFSQVVPY